MKPIVSIILASISTTLITSPSSVSSQDDSYHEVRFVNESGETVKVKYWNPRGDERDSGSWTIEAGKKVDFADKEGKKLRVGIYSSRITVNEGEPHDIVSVSTRSEDGSVFTITWTDAGFKDKPKAPLE